ncbi:unnamed protein product [Ilex paraguariensis]|uniref:Uncharacterized protein n=1 Tax=Ilex paraguariensis TaxID=185542 RepID=A0ABC8TF29_9AQUA
MQLGGGAKWPVRGDIDLGAKGGAIGVGANVLSEINREEGDGAGGTNNTPRRGIDEDSLSALTKVRNRYGPRLCSMD